MIFFRRWRFAILLKPGAADNSKMGRFVLLNLRDDNCPVTV